MDDGNENEGGLTNPAEPRMFDSVISHLRKTYPKDKMQDVSTNFRFICLLHPANERGLRLRIVEAQKTRSSQRKEITRSEVLGVSGYVPFVVLPLHLLSLGN